MYSKKNGELELWLYIPDLPYLQGVEDSNSDSPLRSELITEQSPTLKGNARPLRSWLRTWKEGGWIRLLSGMTLQPLQAMSLAHSWITSTLSQQDSLASRGQSPDSEKEPMTSDGSGLSSSDWFARYDPEASSWRTSQVSFMEELNTFSETWPRSGSMRNGQVFEHQTLAHPTAESESLSWASPVAADAAQGDIENENTKYVTTGTGRLPKISNNGESGSLGLAREVKHWATPEARDWKGHTITENHPEGYNHALPNDVAMWMTPTVMSANDKFKNIPKDLSRLSSQGVVWSTPTASDDEHKVSVNSSQPGMVGEVDHFNGRPVHKALQVGGKLSKSDQTSLPRLNPKFVEWLMGWPESWLVLTNSESSATE